MKTHTQSPAPELLVPVEYQQICFRFFTIIFTIIFTITFLRPVVRPCAWCVADALYAAGRCMCMAAFEPFFSARLVQPGAAVARHCHVASRLWARSRSTAGFNGDGRGHPEI